MHTCTYVHSIHMLLYIHTTITLHHKKAPIHQRCTVHGESAILYNLLRAMCRKTNATNVAASDDRHTYLFVEGVAYLSRGASLTRRSSVGVQKGSHAEAVPLVGVVELVWPNHVGKIPGLHLFATQRDTTQTRRRSPSLGRTALRGSRHTPSRRSLSKVVATVVGVGGRVDPPAGTRDTSSSTCRPSARQCGIPRTPARRHSGRAVPVIGLSERGKQTTTCQRKDRVLSE